MARNFGMVTPSEYIGLTLEEAIEKATREGFTTRIAERDGTVYFLTQELKNNRINFRVKNNLIKDAFPG